ncbi:rhodanese-related sulfurtransferase [Pontibacter aydingkolensis]|uniref:Rhodanese-like domain-containing protein n=1 Tax=Pontibacter aydingkolensis TaxID=1911536 RepID=A0ABS7CVZ4_9BACT|nr:rhodanese-like domain-containing protein [Pontibacter aydingkolensis]MBW7468002.1 rhodanese-like domain-containing protein [Pontibacter aydingkolensis]
MKKLTFLLASLAFMASCSSDSNTTAAEQSNGQAVEATTPATQAINSEEAKSLLAQNPDIVVLDVRTTAEYAQGHLQQSQLVDFSAPDFEAKLKALDPEQPYLVYCAVGGRSGRATKLMEQLGFKQVYDATDGFSSLKSAGLAVE